MTRAAKILQRLADAHSQAARACRSLASALESDAEERDRARRAIVDLETKAGSCATLDELRELEARVNGALLRTPDAPAAVTP